MKALQVDKRLLYDSFMYQELKERTRFETDEYSEPTEVEFVKIDRNEVYEIKGKERKKVANGIIFCYAAHTTPFIKFKKESKVVFNGGEHTIVKVIQLDHPYKKEVWGYELEYL